MPKGLSISDVKYGTILTCNHCGNSYEVGDMRDNGHTNDTNECLKRGTYWQCGHGWSKEDLTKRCAICYNKWTK